MDKAVHSARLLEKLLSFWEKARIQGRHFDHEDKSPNLSVAREKVTGSWGLGRPSRHALLVLPRDLLKDNKQVSPCARSTSQWWPWHKVRVPFVWWVGSEIAQKRPSPKWGRCFLFCLSLGRPSTNYVIIKHSVESHGGCWGLPDLVYLEEGEIDGLVG